MRYGGLRQVAEPGSSPMSASGLTAGEGSGCSTASRSRIPRLVSIDTVLASTSKPTPGSTHSTDHGLRRRRQQSHGSMPLREIYSSQKKYTQAHHGKEKSQNNDRRAITTVKRAAWHDQRDDDDSKQAFQDRDVEKGVADLDGWPLQKRTLFEPDTDVTRLTFAEWKASGFPIQEPPQVASITNNDDGKSSLEENSPATSAFKTPPTTPRALPISSSELSHQPTWRDIPFQNPSQSSIALSEQPCLYPAIPDPKDPARRLSKTSLYVQRTLAAFIVLVINMVPLVAYFESRHHLWVLIFIVFVKAKDFLSTLISLVVFMYRAMICRNKEPVVSPKTIISLITVSFETEEQIMKTVDSIREAALEPHRQILCFILDGTVKPNIERRIVRTRKTIRRPYVTWLYNRNELIVDCGFLDGLPIIYVQKMYNEGKKDSLILCHDLFNAKRTDMPLYSKLLREEVWTDMLPTLIATPAVSHIDAIFCTDADTTLHPTCPSRLIEELFRRDDVIAACGVLFAELDYRTEWTIWSLFQQFQYTYGQVIRRQAEGIWGRVTCLPGCVTMLKVRPQMAAAISDYAKPIQDVTFWRHQVQYLGTDRRLTFSMLSQDKTLKTIVVPDAVSETVCPQTLKHYVNQRRRWGSNAYFNNYFYCFGKNQYLITRLWAFIDISRMTLIYYRQANNILFLWHLARNFAIIKIVPLLVVTQTPTVWFLILVIFHHPILRRRLHKLLIGLLLNYILSPVLSIVVFTRMIVQLGSSGITWNHTGSVTAKPDPTLRITTPRNSWSSSYRVQRCVQHGVLGRCADPAYCEGGERDGSGSSVADDRPVRCIPDTTTVTSPGSRGRHVQAASASAAAAASTRAPSVAETTRTSRSARSELPPNVATGFQPARRRSSSRPRSSSRDTAASSPSLSTRKESWPLDDGATPTPPPPLPHANAHAETQTRRSASTTLHRRLRRSTKSIGYEEV